MLATSNPLLRTNPFMYSVWERIHRHNGNHIGACVGQTGSGKSYAVMALCEGQDPTFNVDNIVFTLQQLQDLLAAKPKPGTFIMWDEAQVGVSSRSFQSDDNKQANRIATTFRNKNYGLFFTNPGLNMIDLWLRQLLHYLYKPISIDRKNNTALVEIRELEYNSTYEKWYRFAPQVQVEDEVVTINAIAVPLPSKKLRDAYEKKKEAFQDSIYSTGGENKIIEAVLADLEKYAKRFNNGKLAIDRFKLEQGFKWESKTAQLRVKARIEERMREEGMTK